MASQASQASLEAQAGAEQHAHADPWREEARDRRDDHRRGGPGQRADPGLERGVPVHDLQVLGQ
jgi:hypothetical protein